ncbi:phosphatidylinositol mannoside acyltransferase [Cellulosimicrobium sp. CUA-896]|uniref:phosphatidylinositol mannoside acyltransferase n=1 Tax=Cellulosimicrobium sp. CUA-896 TaxID=1517881 RepID=UPI00096783BD|nr:phosphatidylinositol mannoside acyltransferase [Cellulosimicrobium sp. CUA-896]OLT53051.1 phosphatidylinositol mannoside acyltransferase [Cellulosimicrobium sp. CUA-896]
MAIDTGRAFTFAWRHAHQVPEPLLRGVFTAVADVAWLLRGGGVRQLEKNLARVRPGLTPRALRRLSRAGMRSYMRYYREAFTLPAWTPEQVRARVRLVGYDNLTAHLDGDRSPVLALSHQGNWDLAGAYATPNIAPVLTVAERLEPEELFQEFLSFRTSIGIEILALGDGDVFRDLVRGARRPGRIIPLLADRDLTARGVEVEMFGRRARVAAGPAALAVSTGTPLIPAGIYYERLRGARRRAAGTPWGLVIRFFPRVQPPADVPRSEQVAAMTQGWVDALSVAIREHAEDWHMLQKVFVEDLDPERYARTRAAAGEIPAGVPGPQEDDPGGAA